MAVLITLLQALAPLLLKAAEDGTLIEIVETGLRLIGLVKPLLSSPDTVAAVNDLATTIRAIAPAAAQPEDPVMARQGASRFGGR